MLSIRLCALTLSIAIAHRVTAQTVPLRQLVADLTIGDPAVELTSIYSLFVAPNGNIVLLGDDEFRGKLFAPDGTFIRNFARNGHGPGEVAESVPLNAGMVGDTIWIEDLASRRISLYTSDAKPIRDIPSNQSPTWRQQHSEWAGLSLTVTPERLLPGGVAFGIPVGRGGTPGPSQTPLLQMRWDASVVGATVKLPLDYRFFTIATGPDRKQSFDQPFEHIPRYDLSPDGKRLVIATVRDGAPPTVELLHLSTRGDTLGKFPIPFTPDPITKRSIDSVIAGWVAPRSPAGVPAGFPPPARLAGRERELRDSLVVPRYFPPVTRVMVENDGTTWLSWHTPGNGLRWLVVSSRGIPQMQVDQPKGTIRLIDHGVWMVVYDRDNVPSVVRLRVPPA